MRDKDKIHKSIRAAVFERYGYRCFYCGIELDPDGLNPRAGHSIDHLYPGLTEGRDDPANLVAACRHCNGRKRNKSIEEYRSYLFLHQPAYQAAAFLVAAMETTQTPFDGHLRETVEWLHAQAKPIVFFGERGE